MSSKRIQPSTWMKMLVVIDSSFPDGARALRFLRHAAKYSLDKSRFSPPAVRLAGRC